MSLRIALLGLLAVEPASGYDLKRAIDRSTYFIWNATGPQIYNTLHKLREEGYVTSRSQAQTGKPDKQIHTITPKGKAALQDYVSEPVRASVTRDEVLLRIFFGNFANKKTIGRELESYLDRIRHERSYLEATKARIDAHPGRKHEARRFQLLSLRLKVAQYRAMEQELAGFLADEIAEKPQVRESACQPQRGTASAKRRAKRHSVSQG
ncbi:MAG: PadR family transcriptional regulator [Pseudolabrys sp.]